jgi:hypothetical protein
MTSALLITFGVALLVPAAATNFHWFACGSGWAGWASTGLAAAALFCILFGVRLGGHL